MQRFIEVLTSGPIYLSSTARLFSWKRERVDAIGHRLVLQVALAALVADRAIERMVDEQELHHPFARLLHHRRVGEDLRRLAIRAGAQIAHAPWRRRPAASAVRPSPRRGTCGNCRRSTAARGSRSAGSRRRLPRGLQQRVFGGNVDLAVPSTMQLGHSQLAMERSQPCPARPARRQGERLALELTRSP